MEKIVRGYTHMQYSNMIIAHRSIRKYGKLSHEYNNQWSKSKYVDGYEAERLVRNGKLTGYAC